MKNERAVKRVALNFHHLQYFWAVARNGNLTRAAEQLRVAPSALSSQIKQLQDQLDAELFERAGRRLVLTEAGKLVQAYAEEIFASGEELVSTLKARRRRNQLFHVGAVATLSRNFQRSFLRPIVGRANVRLRITSGSAEELLRRLEAHDLDMVLANQPAPATGALRSHLLARQPASLVSTRRAARFRFPHDLHHAPMILPGPSSVLRADFEAVCANFEVRPRVVAEIDDMATIRLVALDTDAIALVPSVVVREELRRGALFEMSEVPKLSEGFFAITLDRKYQHPLVSPLLNRDEQELLAVPDAES